MSVFIRYEIRMYLITRDKSIFKSSSSLFKILMISDSILRLFIYVRMCAFVWRTTVIRIYYANYYSS